jgi:hypothetical protein
MSRKFVKLWKKGTKKNETNHYSFTRFNIAKGISAGIPD